MHTIRELLDRPSLFPDLMVHSRIFPFNLFHYYKLEDGTFNIQAPREAMFRSLSLSSPFLYEIPNPITPNS
jgi:hypothetical protein